MATFTLDFTNLSNLANNTAHKVWYKISFISESPKEKDVKVSEMFYIFRYSTHDCTLTIGTMTN